MSKGSPRLSRLGVLAPAALSACMDASVLAVPAAGAIVSTVLKELSKAFMLKRWFHGSMSAKEAEILMMEKGKNGSFLVRESQARPGEFVLSVRARGRVTHITIRRQHNKYDVGSGEQFDDLVGLIEHFRSYPMTENSGDVLRLSQPLSGTRLRASCLDKRVRNMQITDEASDNGFCFNGEFHSLKLLEDRQTFTCNEGMRPENIIKNRYPNVLPYDQTRVVLRRRDNTPYADYINANYIRPFRLSDSSLSLESSTESLNAEQPKGKVYIATQGCLSNTVNDFWKMVWQENTRIIAMITNEVENGKRKCERYWPLLGQEEHHDTLIIKTISEKLCKDYVVREFSVCGDNCCRMLYHFQFMNWPDHGAPDKTVGVLDYLYEINHRLDQIMQSENAPYQNTICVHCSAGVGRSGTFIALDMLIDKIKANGFDCNIDVVAVVKLLRAQRPGMVQNRTQYRFLYVALRDYITSHGIKSKHNSH